MAPRRARAASSGAPAPNPPAGVERLPDDLLIKVLGHLSVKERRATAVVSQRWHSCAFAPVFCRDVHMIAESQHDEQLESFCHWLSRHGQHLRRLQISVFPGGAGQGTDEDTADEDTADAVFGELDECIEEMVQTAQQLERFVLAWHLSNPLAADAAWVSQLPPTLQELGLMASSELCLAGSLGSLTQLTKLLLLGGQDGVDFEDHVSLPPSVRMLAYGEKSYGDVPPQLSALTNLESLVLDCGVWLPEGYDVCTVLSSLRSLQLDCVRALPSCLGRLTGLERLAVLKDGRDDLDHLQSFESGLVAALQRLTGLTSLYLKGCLGGGSSATVLAGLSRLRQLCFYPRHSARQPLPCGPWSSSLQALNGRVECFERSMPLLESCTALRHVFAKATSSRDTPKFWEWARLHAPLQLLQFEYTLNHGPGSVLDQLAAVRRERPDMRYEDILFTPRGEFNQYETLFLWCDDAWGSMHVRFPTVGGRPFAA